MTIALNILLACVAVVVITLLGAYVFGRVAVLLARPMNWLEDHAEAIVRVLAIAFLAAVVIGFALAVLRSL